MQSLTFRLHAGLVGVRYRNHAAVLVVAVDRVIGGRFIDRGDVRLGRGRRRDGGGENNRSGKRKLVEHFKVSSSVRPWRPHRRRLQSWTKYSRPHVSYYFITAI